MLKARLYDFEMKKKEEDIKNKELSKSDIGWGHQIRSYVLQPYQLVKDNRTSVENSDPQNVLNGEINGPNDALNHLKYVDGVMLGRSICANPFLLNDIDILIFDIRINLASWILIIGLRNILLESKNIAKDSF